SPISSFMDFSFLYFIFYFAVLHEVSKTSFFYNFIISSIIPHREYLSISVSVTVHYEGVICHSDSVPPSEAHCGWWEGQMFPTD
ncbi:MAG: hypothetical protein OEW23_16535, partial [Candidatus Aminicenantes bacterium]|nr:hypothetical protein [Candidatus Aminicenantes bacterium]